MDFKEEEEVIMVILMLIGGSPASTAGGLKTTTIAIIAARPITQTDATFVIPTTDVFSPYVVLAGPPKIAENEVARPSPISVR